MIDTSDLDKIKASIEKMYGVCIWQEKHKRGKAPITEAKRIYCVIAKKTTHHSLNTIGSKINRDHACVINHLKVHDDLFTVDKNYRKNYNKASSPFLDKTCLELIQDLKHYRAKAYEVFKEIKKKQNKLVY